MKETTGKELAIERPTRQRFRTTLGWIVALVCLAPHARAGGDEPDRSGDAAVPRERTAPARPEPDGVQQAASDVLFAPVRWADEIFGEEIGTQESNRSYLRISGTARRRDRVGWKFRASTRLKLDFPRTERRVSLFVAGRPEDAEDDLIDRPDDGTVLGAPAEEDQNNSFVGLNGALVEWVTTRVDLRGGMRAGWKPYTQLRYRQDLPVDDRWLFRLTQTGQWIHEDGVSSVTRLEIDRPIRRSVFRTTGRVTVHEIRGLDWSTGMSYYTPITRRLSISLDTSMLGVREPRSKIVQQRVGSRVRFALRPRWWFLELEPEITWPLTEARRRTPAIKLRTEVVLGWTR